MSIDFSPENEQFLRSAVASGAFDSREEALDRAVDLLRERRERLAQLQRTVIDLPPLPSVLERDSEGYVSVRGHRIGLHLILERLYAGDGVGEIVDSFPSLPRETVQQIVDFAEHEAGPLRAYAEQREAIDQLLYETGRRGPSVAELRKRWLAKSAQPFIAGS